MYDAILEALRSGAHDDALARARALADAHPGDPQALRWLAIAQAQSGQPRAALETIANAIERAPEDAELHLVRGSLLLAAQDRQAAGDALARATELDPNQASAYFLQAQLALARGDADEAERQAKLASRLAEGHPQLDVIEGMVELRRGHAETALKRLSAAAAAGHEDPQLLYALGHAHLQQGHAAFAEQAFTRLLEQDAAAPGLRLLVADLRMQQGRPDEAIDVLQPLLSRPDPGFALQRLAGVLELAAGRPRRALPWLRAAFERQPGDQRLLFALVQTWQRLGAREEAVEALEAALAKQPDASVLWQSRMTFVAPGQGGEVLDRWLAAMPDDPDALEMLATAHDLAGRRDEAIEVTRRVVDLAPGRQFTSELKLAGLELESDPPSAVGRLQALLAHHPQPERQGLVRARLIEARDRAGEQATLVTEWSAARAAEATSTPVPPSPAPSEWPARAAEDPSAPAVALLWGPPGSGAGVLAEVAATAGLPILRDRFSPRAPQDPLQDIATATQLASGEADAAQVVDRWTAALPARGVAGGGPVIDWLPWWDNALLHALRPHLPGARLLVVLRDPRDLLLNWLAFGAPGQGAMPSPVEGARWLAAVLAQVADLHEQDLQPHRLLRVDDALGRADRMMDALNVALDTDLPTPNRPMYAGPRLPAGRWRAYATQLGDAFAELHAVSARLGYPEA